VFSSPAADVIASHGVQHHQFADDNDTQLRFAISAATTGGGLSILAACTADVRLWYMQNGLQLNPDKSEALIIGTTVQLHAVASAVLSVAVAGVELPVAEKMKVLGVVLDRRLTFENHITMVARSCHYHAKAIRHIRHLLSTELASTLARSLILTRLDYCNSLLYGSHTSSIQTLQRVQNNAARIVLQTPRQCHANPLLRQLHWLPVRHRIKYKLAVMTYKIHSTGLPAYLSHHINPR